MKRTQPKYRTTATIKSKAYSYYYIHTYNDADFIDRCLIHRKNEFVKKFLRDYIKRDA